MIIENYSSEFEEYHKWTERFQKISEQLTDYTIISRDIINDLEKIDTDKINRLPDDLTDIKNAFVMELRDLSVAVWNHYNDLGTAYEILDTASEIEVKQEVKKIIEKDKEKLKEINDENAVEIKIKNDLVRIDCDMIQYGSKYIYSNEVSHILWGICKNYINSNNTSDEFTLCFSNGEDTISIDCNRWKFFEVFNKKTSTMDRFRLLLEASLKCIVPQMINNIKAQLYQGKTLSIGNINLYKDYVEYRYGWISKKPICIPWRNLVLSYEEGNLTVYPIGNIKVSRILPLKDTCNAVIFELIRAAMMGES